MMYADLSWPSAPRSQGPLAGLKVLDISRVLAGPYAAMLLGDLGADVIKVEHPLGDETRRWGPPFLGDTDTAVYYLAMNRNKRSIRADLTDDADAALVRALAAKADIVVENFRPGVLSKFGLDVRTVRSTNPSVVYCSITGFGSDSELAHRGGYDLVVQAMGGIMGITGEPDGPPTKVGVASADLAAGMYATIATLAALHERDRSGQGRHVEVALLDAQVASLANQAMNWLAGRVDPTRLGSAHPNVVPYQAFAARGGHLVIAVGSDSQFRALCDVVRQSDWKTDPRFATNAARVEHRDQLVSMLATEIRDRPRDELLALLDAAGVPCGPVRAISEVFSDPFISNRMVQHVTTEHYGEVPQVISPFRFDGQPTPIDLAPPALGQSDAEIREHFAAGASVATATTRHPSPGNGE